MLQFATKWGTGILIPQSYSKIHEERAKSGFWPDFRDMFKVFKTIFKGYFCISIKVSGLYYTIEL